MSVPPPIFHKKPSNKLQLNISRSEQSDSSFSPINYSSYAGSPSRTSVTVSLADYMPQKNINNFENLIFVQLYPDQYAIVVMLVLLF
ncbi:hypothetical protein HZS_4115 [Henneguya salminicola]|nr:hypothetical protein HZS_4115 [Henneguya salminicola]